jgi:hypothetical protein
MGSSDRRRPSVMPRSLAKLPVEREEVERGDECGAATGEDGRRQAVDVRAHDAAARREHHEREQRSFRHSSPEVPESTIIADNSRASELISVPWPLANPLQIGTFR